MKHFHVHVTGKLLPESIRFHSSVFGAEPTVLRDDYARWMLEDPRANFAISSGDRQSGLNHPEFQVGSKGEQREQGQ